MKTPKAVDNPPCGSCQGVPQPTAATVLVQGFGPVVVCADPASCRRRAESAGTWCQA